MNDLSDSLSSNEMGDEGKIVCVVITRSSSNNTQFELNMTTNV